jgi:hypothetical protein
MNLHDSSFGPRMNDAEQKIAILFERHDNHERVCADRYKEIKESISAIRETQKEAILTFRNEMARQWANQEKMMQKMIGVIIAVAAVAEALRKFLNW